VSGLTSVPALASAAVTSARAFSRLLTPPGRRTGVREHVPVGAYRCAFGETVLPVLVLLGADKHFARTVKLIDTRVEFGHLLSGDTRISHCTFERRLVELRDVFPRCRHFGSRLSSLSTVINERLAAERRTGAGPLTDRGRWTPCGFALRVGGSVREAENVSLRPVSLESHRRK
jgi:hypothetical protein